MMEILNKISLSKLSSGLTAVGVASVETSGV